MMTGRDNTQEYRIQLEVFFSGLGAVLLGFSFLTAWTVWMMLQALKHVHRGYDVIAKHSAAQRKRLIVNAQLLILSLNVVSTTSAFAFAISAFDYLEADSSTTVSILWFFLILGMILLMCVTVGVFSPNRFLIKKKRQSSQHVNKSSPMQQSSRSSVSGFYLEDLVSVPNSDPFPDLVKSPGSIYEQIGGEPVVQKLSELFLAKLLNDPRVNHFFGSTNGSILRRKQALIFAMLMGGPAMYSGRSLRSVHARFNLSEESFSIVAKHLEDCLIELQVPNQYIKIIISRVGLVKAEILGLVGTCSEDLTGV